MSETENVPADPPKETLTETLERTYNELATRDEAAPAANAGPGPAPAATAPATAASTDDDAPVDWADEDKAKYRTLAPDQRAWLRAKLAPAKPEAGPPAEGADKAPAPSDRPASLEHVLERHRERFARAGVNEAEVVESLLEAYQRLEANPARVIAELQRRYGVEPAPRPRHEAGNARSGPDPAVVADLAARVAEVRSLRDENMQLVARLVRAQADYARGQWAEVVAAKDESGQPRFPHAEKLRQRMEAEIAAMPTDQLFGRTTRDVMEEVYHRAAWADPVVRREMIARELEAAEALREARRKEELAKAKKAGKPVASRAEPAVDAPSTSGSYREELERVWNALAGSP